jgi:integrase
MNRTLIQGKAARQFLEAIKSKYTRESYERRLINFLSGLNMRIDEFVTKAKRRPDWAQRILINYMLKEKERYLNKQIEASSVRSVMKPLKLLMEMHDVMGINWKKISKMMPPSRSYGLDRAPTMEEMRTMINNSEPRFQAILLVMASSGIRVGA